MRLRDQVQQPDQRSTAQAAARLCAALSEATRLRVRNPPLMAKAERLLYLLELAAAEVHASRNEGGGEVEEEESRRRERLVHALAVHQWAAGSSGGV